MAFKVMTATITGRTASGKGFDLILRPEHTRAIGFSKVPWDEIAPGVRRVTLPVDFVLHKEGLDPLLEFLQDNGPGLIGWVRQVQEDIALIRESEAFVDLLPNPSVKGECGGELCYYDRHLNVVVCVE